MLQKLLKELIQEILIIKYNNQYISNETENNITDDIILFMNTVQKILQPKINLKVKDIKITLMKDSILSVEFRIIKDK